jgi:hypothetical protein
MNELWLKNCMKQEQDPATCGGKGTGRGALKKENESMRFVARVKQKINFPGRWQYLTNSHYGQMIELNNRKSRS